MLVPSAPTMTQSSAMKRPIASTSFWIIASSQARTTAKTCSSSLDGQVGFMLFRLHEGRFSQRHDRVPALGYHFLMVVDCEATHFHAPA